MILETAQLLCSACNHVAGVKVAPYKSTHEWHPCAVWARETAGNYRWLLSYLSALGIEKRRRTGRGHKSLDHIEMLRRLGAKLIKEGERTPHPRCLGSTKYADVDTHTAYRLYLADKWRNSATGHVGGASARVGGAP